MVRQPLVFTMEDITRYPSVSKFYFLECSGNTLTDWTKAASPTVQQSHGLLSCTQWTGIPVSWLLDEAGILPGAKWVLFEGADGSGHTRSIPIEKVLDDCLLVYGQGARGCVLSRAIRCGFSSPAGKAMYRSNGCGESKWVTSLGTSAARPPATPTRCRAANGASSAS